MSDFPSNSFANKDEPEEPKEPRVVEQVTEVPAKTRKKSLGKRFSSVFLGGDAKTASQYVILEVILPTVKETMVEAVSSGFERLIWGDRPHRRRYGPGVPPPTQGGYVNYSKYSMSASGGVHQVTPRTMSRRARAQHDFDEIVLESRGEAELVIERLYDVLNRYEFVTVADLYKLVGLDSTPVDRKWGWLNLSGTTASRLPRGGGYLLDLPEPVPIG